MKKTDIIKLQGSRPYNAWSLTGYYCKPISHIIELGIYENLLASSSENGELESFRDLADFDWE